MGKDQDQSDDRRSIERELKRGSLELIVLHLLASGEAYGYEIVSKLTAETNGALEVNSAADVIDDAPEQDAAGDEGGHPRQRNDEEHRDENELSRDRCGACTDLEVETERDAIGHEQEEEDEHSRLPIRSGEQRRSEERSGEEAAAEDERRELLAPGEPARPARPQVADRGLDGGVQRGLIRGTVGHVRRQPVATAPRIPRSRDPDPP